MKKIKTILLLSSLLLISSLFLSNIRCQIQSENLVIDKDSISIELLNELNKDFSLWYPLSIDTEYGGFFSDIDYKWKLDGTQNKMIVSQARHVWSASNASIFYLHDDELLKIAEHGFQFLKNFMWDKKYGGFYELVDRMGKPVKDSGKEIKTAYGNSFTDLPNTMKLQVIQQLLILLSKHFTGWKIIVMIQSTVDIFNIYPVKENHLKRDITKLLLKIRILLFICLNALLNYIKYGKMNY